MVSAISCAMVKSSSFSCKLRVLPAPNWLGNSRSIIAPLVIRPPFSWLTWTLLPPADAPAPPTRMLPCASAYTWLSTPLSGVINNVPPRKLLAFPIEETTTSMVCPWRPNGGSDAVTITAATFLSCILVPVGTVIPNCESMLLSVCVVNGVWVVWSPVPSRPTTSP